MTLPSSWRLRSAGLVLVAVAALAGTACMRPVQRVDTLAGPRAGACTGPPAGHYVGIITGRELATAASVSPIRARLTIWPEGRWAMQTDSDRATGWITCPTPDLLLLAGHFEDGPVRAGAPAWYRLARRDGDDFFVGTAVTHFAGHTVRTGIQLRRADGSPHASDDRPEHDGMAP